MKLRPPTNCLVETRNFLHSVTINQSCIQTTASLTSLNLTPNLKHSANRTKSHKVSVNISVFTNFVFLSSGTKKIRLTPYSGKSIIECDYQGEMSTTGQCLGIGTASGKDYEHYGARYTWKCKFENDKPVCLGKHTIYNRLFVILIASIYIVSIVTSFDYIWSGEFKSGKFHGK